MTDVTRQTVRANGQTVHAQTGIEHRHTLNSPMLSHGAQTVHVSLGLALSGNHETAASKIAKNTNSFDLLLNHN